MRPPVLILSLLLLDAGCSCGEEDDDTTTDPTSDADADTDTDSDSDTDSDADTDTGTPITGDCADFDPLRRAFFGETHAHSSWSFDSYALGNYGNDPSTAYDFAKGNAVPQPPFETDGTTPKGGRMIQLRAPLDFMAMTDHADMYAETNYCTVPPAALPGGTCGPGAGTQYIYCTQECILFRTTGILDEIAGFDMSFVEWADYLNGTPPVRNPAVCDASYNGVTEVIDCAANDIAVWDLAQAITEAADDPCTFSAFHGYEWTRALGDDAAMLHRNILFRGSEVPETPISTYVASDPYEMLAETRDACTAVPGCEFLAIPHNPNLSYGLMFQVEDAEDGLLLTEENAQLRADFEPIVEMMQIKGSSECRNGFERYGAAYDEFCEFEVFIPLPMCTEPGADPANCLLECDPLVPNPGVDADLMGNGGVEGCQASTDFLRNGFKEALVEQDRLGFNPFKYGFVGGTDTHNGTPSAVAEETFLGSHGKFDDEPAEHVDKESSIFANIENPGGLAVVWAEENTRASIFDAMMRKETYATSGPRITHRFFGGWDLPSDLCDDPNLVQTAYAAGVPMGGTLTGGTGGAPSFLTWATRAADVTDPGGVTWPGTPLQRIQIIKIWTDTAGDAHEAVYDVTPNPDNGATVNPLTCDISRTGEDELCAVWTDPDFDAAERAMYYTRVLEDPTCRWSTYVCNDNRSDWDCSDPDAPEYWEGCCDATVPKTVQERAWGSPIWIDP